MTKTLYLIYRGKIIMSKQRILLEGEAYDLFYEGKKRFEVCFT